MIDDGGLCAAMSRTLVPGKPESYQICTRDPEHRGDHTSCDGRGHVLASWPRVPFERHWSIGLELSNQPED